MQQLGQGGETAGRFFGEVAADNASNDFQDFTNKLLYGDPTKTTIGSDGQPQQDLGYFGLKGRAALDARPGVEQQIDQRIAQLRGQLSTPDMQLQFDNFSRRYRTMLSGRVGEHADSQATQWYGEVNKASGDLAMQHIANNADNDAEFLHGLQDGKMAAVKQAQIAGGGPELQQQALDGATRKAYATRIETIGATDPVRALKMTDDAKDQLGTAYPELRERLETRAKDRIADHKGDVAWRQTAPGAPATGGYSVPQLQGAFLGQESGNRDNAPTSIDNAHGPGQITPGTFAKYAQPGERIDNPADNRAVQARILADYNQRYGGDAQRVAVAYFSGPGNVAPPGYPTPWIHDSRDGYGTSTRDYVNGIMARLGGAPAAGGAPPAPPQMGPEGRAFPDLDTPPQAISLEQRREAAFKSIMDDADMDFDQRRRALEYVQQQYTARTTETSAERQTLESTVPSLIQAAEYGVQGVTIPQDRIDAVMPPAKAAAWRDEFAIAQDVGGAMRSLRWASPGDVAQMQRDIDSGQGVLSQAMSAHGRGPAAGPGLAGASPEATENQAMQFRLREGMSRQFDRQVALRESMLNGPAADPAQYVMDHPTVAKAAAALKAAPNDPAAFAAYASATLGVQKQIGVESPTIYTKAQAEFFAKRWSNPPEGQASEIGEEIHRMAGNWGQYWPQVYQQIAPKASYGIRVIGAGTQGTAAREFLSAQDVTEEDLLKGQESPGTVKSDISDKVAADLRPLAQSLAGDRTSQVLADYQKFGEKLAAIRLARGGRNAEEAAQSAIDDILNFKYDFQGSYRIPKSAGIDPRIVQAGVVEATRLLGDNNALSAPGGPPDERRVGPLALASKADVDRLGLPSDYLAKETAQGWRDNGVWMTDPGGDGRLPEGGLTLVRPDGFAARRPDGSRVMLTWGQLATLGLRYQLGPAAAPVNPAWPAAVGPLGVGP